MFAFTVRRIAQAVLVMFVISFIGFAIKYAVGDPVRDLVGISVSAEEREALRDQLGLNDPFIVQWGRFLKTRPRATWADPTFLNAPLWM